VHSIGGLFPFTDVEQEDPVSGQRGALLERLRRRGRVPKIFSINGSAEYWRGDGSLVHTDVMGQRDVAPPPEVRIYLLAGTQHTPGAIPPPPADANTGGRGRHMFSPVDYSPLLRAALVNLDRWVGEGTEPPPSMVPRIADGSAVTAEQTRKVFESIPGATFPDRVARTVRMDFGPEVERGIIAALPPKVGAPFETFVSAVDADGNEIAGIRPMEIPGAPRHLYRVESEAPRAGSARRSHEHDGLHVPLRAHRRRARKGAGPAAVHGGALWRPRGLSRARAEGSGGNGRLSMPARRGHRRW
jgi:hypothetical protein